MYYMSCLKRLESNGLMLTEHEMYLMFSVNIVY